MRRLMLVCLAALCCGGSLGCSIFPESMQPHQLWKWNRVKGPSQDPFFSVNDPIERMPPLSFGSARKSRSQASGDNTPRSL